MGKKKKFTVILVVICLIIAIVVPVCYHEVYISYNDLAVNTYDIKDDKIKVDNSKEQEDKNSKSKIKNRSNGEDSKAETKEINDEQGSKPSVKFVVVGDLHDNTFGDDDDNLVATIKSQKPDFIIADGDILNDNSKNSDIAMSFIKRLVDIAPVYYALGNHEFEYMQNQKSEDLIDEIGATGATLLEMDYEDIVVNGVDIRIGGMYGYAFDPNGLTKKKDMGEGIYDFLKDFEDTSNYKIMMSHRPDSFVFGEASKAWDIDLVVSAHDHGGQVVVPFLGGLYGGDQGYFPEYIHGLYDKDDMKLLITSGLGSNDQKLPRFNNVPEVMVVNLGSE